VSEARAPLAMIVGVARGGVIGRAGGLPWHLPEDLRHFKAATTGHAIIMGRRTWESIGRALPGRTSVVVSTRELDLPPGVLSARDLDAALHRARAVDPEPFVIGGATLYQAAMPLATRLSVTEIDLEVPDGDTFFPAVPGDFREVSRRAGATPGLVFVEYVR
jgi:dihydrofolate reductase